MRIAIQHDHIRQKNGEDQSFSARWTELATRRGIEVVDVAIDDDDFFDRLRDCDGFMWRFGFDPWSLQRAKRLLPAIEHGMGLPVFPSQASSWHFEDKIAQRDLLQAAGLPTPQTWVLWNAREARAFVDRARFPLVAKLSSGIQSNNVRLLRTRAEAVALLDQMFGSGVLTLAPPTRVQRLLGNRLSGLKLIAGRPLPRGIQHGYLYLQEFLPDNPFDTRITVIGRRAYGFRRHNRPGDFRASGSGLIDWRQDEIDEPTIRLAFRAAQRLNTQSIAIDGLRRGDERVVGEISYTYAAWALRDCPGHWTLDDGDWQHGTLTWREGRLRAEDAIFDDFVAAVRARAGDRAR